MARLSKPQQNAKVTGKTPFAFCVTAMMLCMFAFSAALITPANASSKKEEPAETKDDTTKKPELPDTVMVLDPVTLTVVLPKSGAIRQLVFDIWLEANDKASVETIENSLPKIINAFLVDLQRLMYSDTKNRYETRKPGKRGFRFDAPPMLTPPPPKTEEELEAAAEAAEKAEENGEEITPEPPFNPFAPVKNRYFAALQAHLLKRAQTMLPPDTLRSVQIRKFYDYWPGDGKKKG
ncbi:hypothetical protein [Thalassospira lucentensis]|uniref:hypothetical protein n=1 Tax=Thalassospira lucentensis TaxID=168935 RepID=UPI00142D5312|nr:hypothetical protein [Thalassospira lucentensis]NIZ00508.1 hypothetical protein [Thalassospira lucentensis]